VVEVFGDSKLVISQLTEEYRCESESLFPLWVQCRELMTQFRYINFYWIPRSQNAEANDLAQKASGYKVITDKANFLVQFLEIGDYRADILNYLKDPARGAPKRIRYKAMKYVLIGDDMFYRTLEGLLLKCLGPTEANRLLHEVHEGDYGTHQSAHKMKWLIRRSGYYWPTMLEDSFKYYKGVSGMSEVQKDTDVISVSNESHHQTMTIQRLGHGHDRQNKPSIRQGSPVHFGHHGLFHQMSGGHPYEVSNIEGC
jgi:hypothetical protein